MASLTTVCVGLKHPSGLILRLFDMTDTPEPQRDGGYKTVQLARPRTVAEGALNGEVRLKGYSVRSAQQALPHQPASYAITENVPEAFFKEWIRQNSDSDLVNNKLLVWGRNRAHVEAQIREYEGQLMGFEPIDPQNLPRGISTFNKEAM
jgi:hypothetical protein